MFFCRAHIKLRNSTTALLLFVVASCAIADKHNNQITQVISSIKQQVVTRNTDLSVANSSVTLDFSITNGESWDEKDSSNNFLSNCLNGKSITGFDYSGITIQTNGGSFYSEAVLYFSSSANGNDGIQLTVGSGNENSGTASFSSNGILDITDSGNLDVLSLEDNKFNLQIYEKIDDVNNSIDARFINGSLMILGVDLTVNNDCPFVVNNISDADLSVTHTSNIIGDNNIGNSIEMIVTTTNNSLDNSATSVRLNSSLSNNMVLTQASCDDNTNTVVASEIEMLQVNDIPANTSLQCILTAEITALGDDYRNNLNVLSDNDDDINNNAVIIVINGPAISVPVNSLFALIVLAFGIFYYSRKSIKI